MKLSKLRNVVLASVLIAAMIAACAPAPTEAPAATDVPSTTELSGHLRISAPPWVIKKFPLEDAIARFTADHPGVTVELNAEDKWNVAPHIAEWKEGTTSVDLYLGGSGSMLAPVIAGGWTVPLDDMLVGDVAPEKWVAGFLKEGHYKKPDGSGTYYPVLPFVGEISIMGVNTAIAEKAGLMDGASVKPIPSYEEAEFMAWMQALADNAGVTGHIQPWDREFMQYNYCGPINAMTGNKCFTDKGFDVTSDSAKKWLSLIAKMNEAGVADYPITADESYDKWKTNEAGSFLAAQGHSMELVYAVTDDESSIAYVKWPGDGGSVLWTHSAWIPKVATENAQVLARAFIREQAHSAFFSQWSFNNYGKLPVLKAYYGDGIERFQDQMPLILEVADASLPVPLYTDMQEYLDILFKYLPEAATNRMSVDDALAAIEKESADLDFTDLRAP